MLADAYFEEALVTAPYIKGEYDEDMTVESLHLYFSRGIELIYVYTLQRDNGERLCYVYRRFGEGEYMEDYSVHSFRHQVDVWLAAFCRVYGLPENASLGEITRGVCGSRLHVRSVAFQIPERGPDTYMDVLLSVPEPTAVVVEGQPPTEGAPRE